MVPKAQLRRCQRAQIDLRRKDLCTQNIARSRFGVHIRTVASGVVSTRSGSRCRCRAVASLPPVIIGRASVPAAVDRSRIEVSVAVPCTVLKIFKIGRSECGTICRTIDRPRPARNTSWATTVAHIKRIGRARVQSCDDLRRCAHTYDRTCAWRKADRSVFDLGIGRTSRGPVQFNARAARGGNTEIERLRTGCSILNAEVVNSYIAFKAQSLGLKTYLHRTS